jgi:hypothetical protein
MNSIIRMAQTITRAKGGTKEREVEIKLIEVPDLWHIAMSLHAGNKHTPRSKAVLECWHLCHDLLAHIKGEAEIPDFPDPGPGPGCGP